MLAASNRRPLRSVKRKNFWLCYHCACQKHPMYSHWEYSGGGLTQRWAMVACVGMRLPTWKRRITAPVPITVKHRVANVLLTYAYSLSEVTAKSKLIGEHWKGGNMRPRQSLLLLHLITYSLPNLGGLFYSISVSVLHLKLPGVYGIMHEAGGKNRKYVTILCTDISSTEANRMSPGCQSHTSV